MKILLNSARVFVLLCAIVPLHSQAQSFAPSPAQIEQFKNLPRAQQEQLAQQMGFDISLLDRVNDPTQEKQEQQARFIALGAGVDAAIKADSHLESTIMDAINTHLRNNKYRETLGLEKITSNKGRPKSIEVIEPPESEATEGGFFNKIRTS